MTGFHDIQSMLDRVLGDADPGNHGAFWRGKTRDEFVDSSDPGLPIIVVGDPSNSNLVKALRGIPPFGSDLTPRPAGAFLRRMPAGNDPASEEDIQMLEAWIAAGCPDQATLEPGLFRNFGLESDGGGVSDATHASYWRTIDHFFLPNLASSTTRLHVRRLHFDSYGKWSQSKIDNAGDEIWEDHMKRADVQESFRYIRFHQQRIIDDFYGASQEALFDSLWKFGGDMLPPDNDPQLPPRRTMNSVPDWFFWIPYIEMALLADDANDVDINLARGWQIGIAADGLVRRRVTIPEFDNTAPDLKEQVTLHYATYDYPAMIDAMQARAVRGAR